MLKVKLTTLLKVSLVISLIACSKDNTLPDTTPTQQTPWVQVDNAVSLIASDDKQVQELFGLAKKTSKQLWNDESQYSKKFSKLYDDEYLEHLEVFNEEDIPNGVFFSLMYGANKLFNFDWKTINSAEGLQYIFNRALQANNLNKLAPEEVKQLVNGELTRADFEEKSKKMVMILESIISSKNMRILWIKGGGDYYEFFIVKPSVAESLDSRQLNKELVFSSPLYH